MSEAAMDNLPAEMVADLQQHGWLTSPRWRDAFASVPRHVFLPRFFHLTSDGRRYQAVDSSDPDWLELIYANTSLPTQLDADDSRWDQARRDGPTEGEPTCSSTQPSLMAVMLHELDVRDTHRILEIGTGTGYNAALLCHRLCSNQVTSIDVDPGLVARAREHLAETGYAPTLASVDGEAGYPADAPYDRLISTCSVNTVPPAWLTQVTPGGVILTSLHREIEAGLLLRLTVDAAGRAHGHLLDDCGCFMPVRSQPNLRTATLVRAATKETGQTRESALPAPLTGDSAWAALVALMMPRTARLDIDRPEGAVQWLVHSDGSWAYHDTTAGTVEQGGPHQLWTAVERIYRHWATHGEPSRDRIGVSVTETEQHIWLGSPDDVIELDGLFDLT